MSDPVASKSGFLCMYMKNHPDTLVAYVKYFGKVAGNVVTAEMTSIDTQGMNLSYKLKSGEASSVRVAFDPPLASYEEVKPRLLTMKAESQEGLGMLQTPQITSFRLPTSQAIGALIFCFGTAYYFNGPPPGTSLPYLPASVLDVAFAPARSLVKTTGLNPSVNQILGTFGVAHALESIYAWSLCRRYVKGAFVTAAYVASTVLFGFPMWADLKKRVQEKRIESVMKAE
ncbi:hypothetical protein HYDPIDRAFT_112916 [Hydnomerulius pinastri MD-312]|uniref:DUF2470 domain-containing protein n=1 Tax=Hydnomerulius pinastri MD-312 TaxID=994086 RepID=A0A0C9VD43_9AGAM|nr:hypothetical protein HYDPIDRAFT_112916 [Hydnomerulius pinastri MD-312]